MRRSPLFPKTASESIVSIFVSPLEAQEAREVRARSGFRGWTLERGACSTELGLTGIAPPPSSRTGPGIDSPGVGVGGAASISFELTIPAGIP